MAQNKPSTAAQVQTFVDSTPGTVPSYSLQIQFKELVFFKYRTPPDKGLNHGAETEIFTYVLKRSAYKQDIDWLRKMVESMTDREFAKLVRKHCRFKTVDELKYMYIRRNYGVVTSIGKRTIHERVVTVIRNED